MYYPECLPPILDFLDRIEMPFKAGPFGQDGFLPGIQIVNGVMLIDPDRLAGSGDVLHELGTSSSCRPAGARRWETTSWRRLTRRSPPILTRRMISSYRPR